VFTHRTAVSWAICLLSLVTLAGCFGKPMKIKANDAASEGKQSDGTGAGGGEAGPGDGPGPVADSKIATDGPSSNGGGGGNSGTVDASVGGSGGSMGGATTSDASANGGSSAGGGSATGANSTADSGAGGSVGGASASDASASGGSSAGGSSAGGSSGAGSGGNIGGGVAGSGGTGPDAAPDVPPDVPAVDAPGTCSSDRDCTSPAPLCLGNRCAKCSGDSDCAGRAGPACAASGSCVACTSNKHCTGTAGTCDPATNQCVGCVSRSDCTSACQTCTSGVCVAVKGKDDPGFCDGTCDPAGTCKRKQGQTCQKTTDCAGGLPCADGYCCDRACTGSCEACDIAAPSPGTCTSLPAGAPPYASHPACSTSKPFCYSGQCAECLPGSPACSDTQTLKICQAGAWMSRTCQGNTPVCLNTDCVQCVPGTARCDGFNLQNCSATGVWQPSTCQYGCWNDRCLLQSARVTAGVVQCDQALLCPTDKVCCYNKNTHVGSCQATCTNDDQYGTIACDGQSDCSESLQCCSTRYNGVWQSTTCGLCQSASSEFLLLPTCNTNADCAAYASSCEIEQPTTTILGCQ
jgi:hypothetical protein